MPAIETREQLRGLEHEATTLARSTGIDDAVATRIKQHLARELRLDIPQATTRAVADDFGVEL